MVALCRAVLYQRPLVLGLIPFMTTIVYIFGICWFGKSWFGKRLEFWIQKSVRNLFAQYDDVIESKQSHPFPIPHSTSA